MKEKEQLNVLPEEPRKKMKFYLINEKTYKDR